ncbi:MAG: hypothetical protein RL497_2069 [Pseudomonadota bacterium]|jgi:hypothetical protein
MCKMIRLFGTEREARNTCALTGHIKKIHTRENLKITHRVFVGFPVKIHRRTTPRDVEFLAFKFNELQWLDGIGQHLQVFYPRKIGAIPRQCWAAAELAARYLIISIYSIPYPL